MGSAVARNRGVMEARTGFVAFLDQDDLWLPSRHERLLRVLATNPEVRALVTTELRFFLEKDRDSLDRMGERLHALPGVIGVANATELLDTPLATADDTPPLLRQIPTRELLAGPALVTTSFVVHRETFVVSGGCPTFARSHDDYWLLLNLSRLVDVFAIDEPSICYRLHPGSAAMSTRWAMPLLASLSAARYGGNLVPTLDARKASAVGYLADSRGFWIDQLLGLARGSAAELADALAFTQLLAAGNSDRRKVSAMLLRQAATSRLRRVAGLAGWNR